MGEQPSNALSVYKYLKFFQRMCAGIFKALNNSTDKENEELKKKIKGNMSVHHLVFYLKRHYCMSILVGTQTSAIRASRFQYQVLTTTSCITRYC